MHILIWSASGLVMGWVMRDAALAIERRMRTAGGADWSDLLQIQRRQLDLVEQIQRRLGAGGL